MGLRIAEVAVWRHYPDGSFSTFTLLQLVRLRGAAATVAEYAPTVQLSRPLVTDSPYFTLRLRGSPTDDKVPLQMVAIHWHLLAVLAGFFHAALTEAWRVLDVHVEPADGGDAPHDPERATTVRLETRGAEAAPTGQPGVRLHDPVRGLTLRHAIGRHMELNGVVTADDLRCTWDCPNCAAPPQAFRGDRAPCLRCGFALRPHWFGAADVAPLRLRLAAAPRG